MSKVKVVTDNTQKLLKSLSGDRLGQAVIAGALLLETAVKISMASHAHTGRTYKRGKKKHVASAPGETPAVDTGTLLNSIESQLVESSETTATAIVGTNVEYAPYLEPIEFGTSRIAPRPFMRPAADKNEEKIKQTVRNFAKRNMENAL